MTNKSVMTFISVNKLSVCLSVCKKNNLNELYLAMVNLFMSILHVCLEPGLCFCKLSNVAKYVES